MTRLSLDHPHLIRILAVGTDHLEDWTPLVIPASGLRSSCPSIANWSLRRSASFKASAPPAIAAGPACVR